MNQTAFLKSQALSTDKSSFESETPDMKLAVWVLTPNGLQWARHLVHEFPSIAIHCSHDPAADADQGTNAQPDNAHRVCCPPQKTDACQVFSSLSRAISEKFNQYDAHLFIMSTGIVVRMIAPLIRHKTIDPAVIVMDDQGQHVISLLCGHIGGANALARKIAARLNADPVITTATDVNQLPAIDVLAKEQGLAIENPEAIKAVNMAILNGGPIRFHDPHDLLFHHLPVSDQWRKIDLLKTTTDENPCTTDPAPVYVFIDDSVTDLPAETLVLRPRTLAVGIGCNRNTPKKEMQSLLQQILQDFGLAEKSLAAIASISIKRDEKGLLELSRDLALPLQFFDKEALQQANGIQRPSAVVEKHTGVQSVCEAAAILSTKQGNLIVPKHSTPNATVAIARMAPGSTL
jgi:cobalt-precorrin 5A hydrolase